MVTPAAGNGFGEELQVVVLDDEEAILSSIKSLFRKFPYKFRLFTTAHAAIQVVRTTEVDVVISDLRMPDTNGLEFMKEVQKSAPLSERVLMSGFEDKGIVLLALSAGMINHFVYKPWEEEEFRDLLAKCNTTRSAFRKRGENDMLYEFEDLPAPPRFHQKLNEMLASMDAPIGRIVQEIELNPSLVARLLRVANSVHLGVRKRVSSVKEAVFFIGLEYIASMVTALEAFGEYSAKVPPQYAPVIEEMTVSAVRRATFAKEIASRWPGLGNRYVPYVASLLQDIGIFARVSLRPEQYGAFLRVKQTMGLSDRESEAKIFGSYSHERIGAAILEHWNFPQDIVNAVAEHHAESAPNDFCKIVQLAMLLEGRDDGFSYDPEIGALLPEWRARLGENANK